jgi:hypothetical protein
VASSSQQSGLTLVTCTRLETVFLVKWVSFVFNFNAIFLYKASWVGDWGHGGFR